MRRYFAIALILTGVGALAWIVLLKRPRDSTGAASSVKLAVSRQNQSSLGEHSTPMPQIDVASLQREQVEAELRRREAIDRKWEWKTPIVFYGKVVDEKGTPVSGVDIRFQWTDLSIQGTSDANGHSDENGFFSLANVKGKRLLVRVSKAGYYPADARNETSFEYANPFEEIYHQPSPANPVLFRLRKQNGTADVLTRSVEVVLPGDGTPVRVDVEAGKVDSHGQLEVRAWKPWPPRPMSPAYDWKVMFSLAGGGFAETREEFPFEAPESGYEEQYVIDMSARQTAQWKVSAERSLYFTLGEPKRYGHVSIRTDGNSRYIFLDYVINSSGSRSLEGPEKRK